MCVFATSSEQENPAGNWPVPTLQSQGTGLGWSWEAFQRYWLKCKRRVGAGGGGSSEIMSLSYELYGACWKDKTKHLTQNSDVQILQFLLNFLKDVVFCQVCHYHFHIFPCGFTWRGEMGVGGVGTSISDSWQPHSSSQMGCHPLTNICEVFTYSFGHQVQICSAPAYDDHIHSLLSQLWEAEVQSRA